jgi:hypothetical protein
MALGKSLFVWISKSPSGAIDTLFAVFSWCLGTHLFYRIVLADHHLTERRLTEKSFDRICFQPKTF